MTFDGYVVVREIVLPDGVHGMTKEDYDGIMNVYVNEADPDEEKEKTILHEMRHIKLGHFGSGRDVAEMESEAM